MELKNFYIGKSKPISLKYGKQEIRQVFLSKELFYEQPINITINLSKGISSVVLTVVSTEEKTETHTLNQKSNVISVGYGYKIVFSNLVLQTNYSPSSNNPTMGKEYEVTKVSTYSFSASYIAPTVYYDLKVTLGTGGKSVKYNGSRMTQGFERTLAEGSYVTLSEPTPETDYEFENYLINGSSITKPSHSFYLTNDTVVNVNFEAETIYDGNAKKVGNRVSYGYSGKVTSTLYAGGTFDSLRSGWYSGGETISGGYTVKTTNDYDSTVDEQYYPVSFSVNSRGVITPDSTIPASREYSEAGFNFVENVYLGLFGSWSV